MANNLKDLHQNVKFFTSHFRAWIRPSNSKSVYANIDYTNSTALYQTQRTYDNMIDITISEKAFNELTTAVEEYYNNNEINEFRHLKERWGNGWIEDYFSLKKNNKFEQQLREKNPNVQKAWEQYQILLEIAR